MKLTERQQEAIEIRGANLLVSASAGSGKTEVLARRCAALIADAARPCGIDRLLVVTFTRAAAAELRTRVGKMLRARLGEARQAGGPLEEHLQRQLILLELAEIGTIDGWCARLARQHFTAVPDGVDPGFAIMGEEEALLLRREIRDELFEEIYRSTHPRADTVRAWLRRGAKPDDHFFREAIEGLNRYRDHLVNADQWLADQADACRGHAESIRAAARRLWAAALAEECEFQRRQLQLTLQLPVASELQNILSAYSEALGAWSAALLDADQIEVVTAEISAHSFPRKPRGLDGGAAALLEEIKTRWFKKRLRDNWDDELVRGSLETAPRAAELADVLLSLEDDYQRRLNAAKRARGTYEFGDVQRMALDLLGAPAAGQQRVPRQTALELRRRYEHILVDEYQDTSPVQVELLRLVTREAPDPPNCFMVGDVKQSIYGFREAEPRLFADRLDCYQRDPRAGRALFLPDNFRSHHRLVEGLNEIFAALFEREFGGTEYSTAERLRAGREELADSAPDTAARIEMHVLLESHERAAGEDEDGAPAERIEREGCRAAELIQELFRRDAQIPDRDAEGRLRSRSLRWSDVVILLRSMKQNGPRVARVLRDAGIPCMAAGRESLLDSVEVRDVRTVLSLLMNRRQDVALAAYLRGPFGGLSAEQLLLLRRAAPPSEFYDAIEEYLRSGPDESLKAALGTALRRLDEWRGASRTEDLNALLRRILRESEAEFFARALPGEGQRVALLRALEDLAREAAAGGARTVADFVQFLDRLEQGEITPQVAAVQDQNVVRIMTIHAAKGLEFPIVFLLGMGAEFSRRPRRGALECDEQTGLGVEFLDYPARQWLRTAAFGVNRQRVSQRELEEELRLFYVAGTRAREKLILMGHSTERAWIELRERCAGGGGHLPLISRLAARSMFEWAGQAIFSDGLCAAAEQRPAYVKIELLDSDCVRPPVVESFEEDDSVHETAPLASADATWIERSIAALRANPGGELARWPAAITVSTAKRSARIDNQEETPPDLDLESPWGMPAFARVGSIDGREVGEAYHRFMQFADFTRLESESDAREQIRRCVELKRLSERAAALIVPADVAWFAGTAAGRRAAEAGGRCRREAPFVYACPIGNGHERVILRGVIDCLIETEEGLLLLDYKTDRARSEQDRRRRLTGYEAQLRWYARAARAAFGREVCAGELVFFRERICVAVDLFDEELSPDIIG